MIRLVLHAQQRAQIEREARVAFPRECCGLIEGVRGGALIRAIAVHATRNNSTETDRFEIDPAEHFVLLRAARAVGHEIVGCYHSHPNGKPDPSERDRNGSSEEGFIWLIAALTAPDAAVSLRGFVVAATDFEAVALE